MSSDTNQNLKKTSDILGGFLGALLLIEAGVVANRMISRPMVE